MGTLIITVTSALPSFKIPDFPPVATAAELGVAATREGAHTVHA